MANCCADSDSSSPSALRTVATSLVDLIRGHTSTVGDRALRITASIGLACTAEDEAGPHSAEALLARADARLYLLPQTYWWTDPRFAAFASSLRPS